MLINQKSSKENTKIRYKLLFMLTLTVVYMVAEVIGSVLTNSLALLADAGHMLGDFAALSMSYFAAVISLKPASAQKTYGYYRTEILVALINGLLLVFIGTYIIYQGIIRALAPPEVQAPLMIIIATGGLFINLLGLAVLHSSAKTNLNVKGAYLHVIGDTLGSTGAIIAGLLIYFYKFYYADIIISFIIATLIIYSAIKLILEASHILLEGVPKDFDVEKVKAALLKVDEVKKVHELHVWCISQQRIALSVHLVSDHADSKIVLYEADKILREQFNVDHLTIQVEPSDFSEKTCDF